MNQENQSYQFEEKSGKLVSVIEASIEQKNQKMSRMGKLGSFLSNVVLGVEPTLDSNDEKTSEEANQNIQEEVSYWDYTGETYTGIYPPQDTINKIWMPTDKVSQVKVDENTSKIDPVWEKVTFNFKNVINRVHYEDMLTSFNGNTIVSVYESQMDALKEESAVTNFDFTGSIIGVPEQLVDDVFVKVENLDDSSILAEELVFPLYKGETVIGYMNGKAVVEGITQKGALEMLQSSNQEGDVHES